MIFNRKIKLETSKEIESVLDGQSKMCNWLYNQLFEAVEEDYKNGKKRKFLNGRNLRNEVPKIKEKHPFLYKVHSSPLKNAALRLKEAYDRFFDPELDNQKPTYRSWKRKWFSLFYDEPNKGFKLLGENRLRITLGKLTEEEHRKAKETDKKAKRQIEIVIGLKEAFQLDEDEKVKTLRITKDLNGYYAVFTVEKITEAVKVKENSFIVFDPNHKNLAVGMDHEGKSYELKALSSTLRYWDKRIDQLKSKRDKCSIYSKLVVTSTSSYWKPSKRWSYLNRALERAHMTRREQIKQVLYSYAHYFSKRYDHILIGDYVPTPDVAKYGSMKRAMLNQTPIGQFRTILEWVQEKNNKHYTKVDEYNTTKECCACGYMENKEPDVRVFTCPKCKTKMYRDINSAVNIGKKARKLLPRLGYVGVENPTYTVEWNWKRQAIVRGKFRLLARGNESLGENKENTSVEEEFLRAII
ncbi:RNA-guided endonuclease InsQ/TnpB family protein [Bacillus aerolatus]|uniref:RNA-guided endonuclease InsQ/TnpB family protein n=1 Tax=Bacillus aerolatus TaxID=2653354 RepID=UPI001CDCA38C|nr:RNA-guided endonuclease TnpB family protein [Bacillus aerolatus]